MGLHLYALRIVYSFSVRSALVPLTGLLRNGSRLMLLVAAAAR